MSGALRDIAALIQRESGILLAEAQLGGLDAALNRIDPACEPAVFLTRLSDPVAGPSQLARLLDEMTVKETFFLRDAVQLRKIQWPVLLQQARRRGAATIRVWSAGCATGEEAYSLAVLACEFFNTFQPPVSILATDISGRALADADRGEYRARSTRGLDPPTRERFFVARGDRLVVGAQLRALVLFARHNLVRDPVPPLGEPPFDLILCRNVLIYFDGETVRRVIRALDGALASSGMLILGAADALFQRHDKLQTLQLSAAEPRRPESTHRHPGRRRADRLSDTLERGTATRERVRRDPPPTGSSPTSIRDPPGATEQFLRGLRELEAANTAGAIAAFRAALYTDPLFGLAAFQLGRCYEAVGKSSAAQRAYRQALIGFDHDLVSHDALLEQIELADVRTAAQMRLRSLSPTIRHPTDGLH